MENFRRDHDNGFIYRRPPELKAGEIDTSKPVERHEKAPQKVNTSKIEDRIKYAVNTTQIGGKVDYTAYMGGSMLSANEGINKNASKAEAGGDLNRFRRKYHGDLSHPDQLNPQAQERKITSYKDFKDQQHMHQRRRRHYE